MELSGYDPSASGLSAGASAVQSASITAGASGTFVSGLAEPFIARILSQETGQLPRIVSP